MEFFWDNIWAILVVLLVLWIVKRVITDRPGYGDHFQMERLSNIRLREMEDGNFTDQDLKMLLPAQKNLAVSLVRKKFGLGSREALAYVQNIENNLRHESISGLKMDSTGHLGGAVDGSVSDELREKVKKIKDGGNHIEAIKALKAGVDIDLKSAKDYVDQL